MAAPQPRNATMNVLQSLLAAYAAGASGNCDD
ncbi:hypothetical protein L682_23700 [Aquipseudomonas alcaligenes OT 69]|nr:hypothetical protein L682_23700 [Pseudomonas alcaligenes OT 69]